MKIIHKAKHIKQGTGQVSALCSRIPKAINLKKESWSIRDEAVTCPACIAKMEATVTEATAMGPTATGVSTPA